MRIRLRRFERPGLVVCSPLLGRPRETVTFGEILTAERRSRRPGFILHVRSGASLTLIAKRSEEREIESVLRRAGVRIVDEWGAMIDESQFEKEADPDFQRRAKDAYRRSVGL